MIGIDEEVARLIAFARLSLALRLLPPLAVVRVMNYLLHSSPELFAALLLREPRENPGRFRSSCPAASSDAGEDASAP